MYHSDYAQSMDLSSQRRHNQHQYDSDSSGGQFMPGDPGGFILPMTSHNSNASSGGWGPSPMGFVDPNVAQQHRQVSWSSTYQSARPASPSSPGGFVIPGASYHSLPHRSPSPPPPQQYYSPPPLQRELQEQNYQQQYHQQSYAQQSNYNMNSALQPPAYSARHVSFDFGNGPGPSRYNINRTRPNSPLYEDNSRSVYSSTSYRSGSPTPSEYTSHDAYPSHTPYRQQQQQQQHYQHQQHQQHHQQQQSPQYTWEDLRYNY
ncbi:hypothetical protein BX661DRAFT_64198 [Kickxella alabastrina]|uniref:uncharacterized protein n=1 Tax=Kickxella alabastrina TaxID=61397 RepID=UPI0022202714|nr:uncharacterized protein BX661DRAFT_64198 [Kickxella alabastrina]KAI7833693.1 hypothetical protein BX661DRAFT_64198 [Kickxella alabastrina]